MLRGVVTLATLLTVAALGAWAVITAAPSAEATQPSSVEPDVMPLKKLRVDRSPVDLVLSPDESWLVTVHQTASTASLIRIADGAVLDEVRVGERPAAVALHPDGKRVLVSGSYAGVVSLLRVDGDRLVNEEEIRVGFEPHGIAVSSDGKTAWVALTAAGQVAVIDLPSREVVRRIDVGRWPRYLALSPDGSRLAVGVSGDRGVAVVDTAARKTLYTERFGGMNLGHMQVSADGQYVYFPWMIYRSNPISPSNIRRGWVLASRFARVRLDGKARREAISLDPQGRAVADPHGIGLTSDEQHAVVSASGTHELLVYRLPDLPFIDYGGPGDHIDPSLLADNDRFFRIELGGRPMGLQIADDDRTVYVANYLDDSVQVVDLPERKVVRQIAVGPSPTPSAVRRGEAMFYDARRSLDQWYSCHSCHYEGGTNSDTMDTLNDGSSFSFKTVLPLYNVAETPPWTWHGWQESLSAGVRKSLTTTMLGPQPSDEDVSDLIAYLKTLRLPPNPYRQPDGSPSPAAQRGFKVFWGNVAGCGQCHSGAFATDGAIHDVGLGGRGDRYRGFNTPSLIGVYRKVRLLHDGRARSLDELLRGPHNPDRVTGNGELTDGQRADLIQYLKSL